MRLEKTDDKILIWETGRQKNNISYDSTKDIEDYTRRELATYELFLRENMQTDEANKISKYLGKIIRPNDIPKLIPTGNYCVTSDLDYLKETFTRYVEDLGLNLDPDFQRQHVWNDQQRIKYVEFILQDGKTPPIYLNHENWMGSFEGDFVIVDGKQRITSLLMFLNNKFPVFPELDPDGKGYFAKDFSFVNGNIEIAINNLPTKKQVLQWYLQMNRGNIAHTEEELQKVEELLESEQ